ncbi:MAG: UbiX family flavin prenyltransferase [Desulfobia sp.]
MKIIIAITGASGSLYVGEFLNITAKSGVEVHGIISPTGEKVLKLEEGMDARDLTAVSCWYRFDDFTAPMASGSSNYDAMVVLPCSMGSLAAIATGYSGNLIHRAADVILKEDKKLILAIRETPFNRNHIKNMLKAHDAGAVVYPIMPAFYHNPQNLRGMAFHFSGRLAEHLGLQVDGLSRWHGQAG